MDDKDRILNYVRWHVYTLHAPAPAGDIEATMTEKGLLYPDVTAAIAALAAERKLRFVSHDFLPDGYSTVEDPS